MIKPTSEFEQQVFGAATNLLDNARYAEAVDYLFSQMRSSDFVTKQSVMKFLQLVLDRYRCYNEVADALEIWLDIYPNDVKALELLLAAKMHLDEITGAQYLYSKILESSNNIEQLNFLIKQVPSIYQVSARFKIYQDLLLKLNQVSPLPHITQVGLVTRASLMLAMGNTHKFQTLIRVARNSGGPAGEELQMLYAIDRCLEQFKEFSFDSPKIFSIGLSKTGTTSLHTALELLGFHSAHWINPVTGNLLGDADFPLFNAFSDTPISYRFEELYYAFPKALFIYTYRPEEAWSVSFLKHFAAFKRDRLSQTFDKLADYYRQTTHLKYGYEFAKIHNSLYFNHLNLYEAYQTYDLRVRNFFSDKTTARFLPLNITGGESWPKLCAFLNLPIPQQTFPWKFKTNLILR